MMLTLPGGLNGGSKPITLDNSVLLDKEKRIVRVHPDWEKGLTGCYQSIQKDLEQQLDEANAVIMAAGRDREQLEAQIESLKVCLKIEQASHNGTVIEQDRSASFYVAVGVALGVIFSLMAVVLYVGLVRP